ncbi:TlpA disulfide reductase family protein [Halobacillus sp. Marseille-Q1614]|uniref:TlpA disulfide reductase family protein n=1 Tax=Halobacillus sp. Marseille-Q1614 TaxID=2709134 RepID=UPI001570E60B|nr:TlpA disulfide reductase family protein [Halobacillus sp. Marseille-Q1614]
MIKQISAALVLLVLIGLIVWEVKPKEETSDKLPEYNVSGNPDQEGTAITPPNAEEGLTIGDRAPDVELETMEGETAKLSDLRGKKVILNFWATWCPPCKEEMPEMEKFHKEYGDEVEIIAVNVTGSENEPEDVYKYVTNNKYTFDVWMDYQLEANDAYHVISIPTTYFIGTDGRIQQPHKVGPMTYDFMVEMKEALK